MDTPIWKPDRNRINNSNMKKFLEYINRKYDNSLLSYQQLYQWSIDQPSLFWESIWDFNKVIHSKKYESVLVGHDIRKAKWFEGARLNFAENLLRFRDEQIAIIYKQENKPAQRITYLELFEQVKKCAHSFKKMGLTKGDRVAAFITNSPEAIIGMLAAASIGAVWTSCSPDFGYEGVLERFQQVKPKILLAVNGYIYNGKIFDKRDVVTSITKSLNEIKHVVIIDKINQKDPVLGNKFTSWENIINVEATDLEFQQLPFDHPLYIMYSSGTTGKPKCIVHGAGGTLLQHLKELVLHTDLKRDDVITYYTTCGWMMWNWLISSLAVGASIYLYDGSPSYPNMQFLFEEIKKEKITIFGTSPKYLSACDSSGLVPKDKFDLSSLKTILSTGSPLSDKNYEYVYQNIKTDVQLSSISGGTDIISCFILGNPMLPVYKGELQCQGLGMKVEAFNEQRQPLTDQVGELVCTAPFPSRPIYFWNDKKDRAYQDAYFKYYPGIWRHGDYIKINSRGGVIVYGRSDATLNRGGIRIGTAEIYGPVESMDEIEDSLVIAKNIKDDSKIILFVVLKKEIVLTDELKQKIKNLLKNSRSPRHIPDEIYTITDIPRTINGKKVELAAAKIINGQEVTNIDGLLNPESLKQFKSYSN